MSLDSQDSRSRAWIFTINNYTDEDKAQCNNLDCQYIGYSFEVGEQGTPHIQGFVYFVNLKSRKQVSALLRRAWLKRMAGSFADNEAYCSKQGQLIERGVPPKDKKTRAVEGGASTKALWEEVWTSAKEGRVDDIPAELRVKHYKTIKEIRRDHMPKTEHASDVTGIWVYGQAGFGKTRWVWHHYPELYVKGVNKWWDGYQGHDAVLVDDVDPDHKCMRCFFKHWADRYPFKAETKGGAMEIRPKTVIFTSQYSIEDCFPGDQQTIDAMKRRCKVVHLPFPWTPPS